MSGIIEYENQLHITIIALPLAIIRDVWRDRDVKQDVAPPNLYTRGNPRDATHRVA